MILLNYNYAADDHGSWGSEIYTEPHGVTHTGWGALPIIGQTYIASVWETDDQSSANPSVSSYDSTDQGHVNLSGQGYLGVAVDNCTQVTYWLDVSNCECFSACFTTSVY